MRVKVSLLGIMAEYAGSPQLEMGLGEGATLGHLLAEVGARLGDRFPSGIWDPMTGAFAPSVAIFLNGRDGEEHLPLEEGSEVILLPLMAGGLWLGAI